jgi:hypothetical protein
MSFVSCNQLNTAVAAKQDKLLDCTGAPLAGSVPTCTQMNTAVATAVAAKQDKLLDCTGVPLAGSVPTCTQMNTAIATAVADVAVEYATPAETVAGLTEIKAVSPKGMAYALQTTSEPYTISVTSAVDKGLTVIKGSFRGKDQAYAQSGDGRAYGVHGEIHPSAVTPTNRDSVGVMAENRSSGAGNKMGLRASSVTTGGGACYGVFASANGGDVNWAGYFNGDVNVFGSVTNGSDMRVKRDVVTIDAEKALAFRNGLRWVTFEKVLPYVGENGEIAQLVTGYEAGLIAQEVQALTEAIGAFQFVVKTQNPDMMGLDYNSINAIVMAAEQALLGQP